MPVYVYACPTCAAHFERFLPLSRYREVQPCPACGQEAEKQLSAVAVFSDYSAYTCPITGARVEGRKAHERNLAKHGCRVLEAGEPQAAARSREAADAALESRIADSAAKFVAELPARKKEQLGQELARGASISVERR